MRFCDVIGHGDLKKRLAAGVDGGRISHAQLFVGSAGSGTLALALAYTQYLHCTNRHDGDSCGECPSCRQIEKLAHPDLHLVYPVNKQGKKPTNGLVASDFIDEFRSLFERTDGYFSAQQWYDSLDLGKTLKGAIAVREAEEMIRKLSFKSFASKYKTMLIWLPETMNERAANMILKILEEPWEDTVFILVAEQPDKILGTILSRTQEVTVPRLDKVDLISEIYKQGITDDAEVRNMARLACGDLLQLRQILSGEEDDIRNENFNLFRTMMRHCYLNKHLELLAWADEVAALSRERQMGLCADFARLLREAYITHAGVAEVSYLWGEEADFCKKFSPYIGSENIEPILELLEQAVRRLRQNGDPRIVLSWFALSTSKYINFGK
ncbi:MAG: DNA polymerase III subunit delta [Alistipes sp.]|nr:DNA polymerase III subunit delta [Alistipes sp.]